MDKHPYLPLYTGDWKKDPALTRCAPATRGIWIDLLCDMHELDRCGELRGTTDVLARVARCSTEELTHALTDLQTQGAADVEQRNGVVTIRNRRMFSESRKRKLAAERQLRHRNRESNAESNGDIPLDIDSDFELFWEEFPRGRRKSKGSAREAFRKALTKADAQTLTAAATAYRESAEGRGAYVKMPSTWLNQECWNDDRAAWSEKTDKPLAAKEYRQVSLAVFNGHATSKDFLIGPSKDNSPAGLVARRVYGQLKSGRKIESSTNPNWEPQN